MSLISRLNGLEDEEKPALSLVRRDSVLNASELSKKSAFSPAKSI